MHQLYFLFSKRALRLCQSRMWRTIGLGNRIDKVPELVSIPVSHQLNNRRTDTKSGREGERYRPSQTEQMCPSKSFCHQPKTYGIEIKPDTGNDNIGLANRIENFLKLALTSFFINQKVLRLT